MSHLPLLPSTQEAAWTENRLQEMFEEGAKDCVHFSLAPALECLPNSDSIHLLGVKPGMSLSITGGGKEVLEAIPWQD